jgi:ketosteroid isomerase-like protein
MWFRSSAEAQIRRQLDGVIAGVTGERGADPEKLRRLLGKALHQDVVVRVPDFVDVLSGREAVVQAMLNVQQRHSITSLSLYHLDISIDESDGTAHASADASVTLRTRDDKEIGDTRRVELQLSKRQDEWQLLFVDVARKTNEQPEARP